MLKKVGDELWIGGERLNKPEIAGSPENYLGSASYGHLRG